MYDFILLASKIIIHTKLFIFSLYANKSLCNNALMYLFNLFEGSNALRLFYFISRCG